MHYFDTLSVSFPNKIFFFALYTKKKESPPEPRSIQEQGQGQEGQYQNSHSHSHSLVERHSSYFLADSLNRKDSFYMHQRELVGPGKFLAGKARNIKYRNFHILRLHKKKLPP